MPERLALLVSAAELVGGIALLLGAFTRLATLPLAGILLVAIAGFKFRAGFLGGWDWPLSVLTLLIAIALLGPGAISVDGALARP
jgi:putative oxidoreductase